MPGGAAMVALITPLGGLHLPQQGVHLWQRQSAVGPDGGTAGHQRQQFLVRLCNSLTGIVQAQLCQNALRQINRIARCQGRRYRANGQGMARQRADVQAQRMQAGHVAVCCGYL